MATLQYHQQQQQQQRFYNTLGGQSSAGSRLPTMQRRRSQEDGPTPICRCRVLYLGSAVPQVTKDGLQGIQVIDLFS